jgi:hypothetical protein
MLAGATPKLLWVEIHISGVLGLYSKVGLE